MKPVLNLDIQLAIRLIQSKDVMINKNVTVQNSRRLSASSKPKKSVL